MWNRQMVRCLCMLQVELIQTVAVYVDKILRGERNISMTGDGSSISIPSSCSNGVYRYHDLNVVNINNVRTSGSCSAAAVTGTNPANPGTICPTEISARKIGDNDPHCCGGC